MPFPMSGMHYPYPALLDVACKLKAKPMPPILDGFLAHFYASLMQEIFNIPQ